MKPYLYEYLSERRDRHIYPFHMPGHKNSRAFFNAILPCLDVTELKDTDDLYAASGVLERSMERAAKVFGADHTFFLTNGSTAGILAVITACVKEGEEILIARNAHRSVYGGLILSGAYPRYIYPSVTDYGFSGGAGVEQVTEALMKFPGIRIAVITSPTYEGVVSDIRGIAKACHEKNIPLIVDEAHGAHFKFHTNFPETALSMGADAVVQSMHKTLPALGQSALLHIKGALIKKTDVLRALQLIQTSSPSYAMMATMDRTIGLLEKDAYDFDSYVKNLIKTREFIGGLKNFNIFGADMINKFSIYGLDISKLVIMCSTGNMTGEQLTERLVNAYKIQMETHGDRYSLGMTSVADIPEGFTRLREAMTDIDKKISAGQAEHKKFSKCPQNYQISKEVLLTNYKIKNKKTAAYFINETVLSPRRAVNAKSATLSVDACAGKISAELIAPCPPGTPLLVPGERISGELVEYIKNKKLKNEIIVLF